MAEVGTPTMTRGLRGRFMTDALVDESFKLAVEEEHEKDGDGKKDGGGVKLGTLVGVYLPCCQNILGVILFLRLPYIAGQAGALMTTVIILLCAASTTLTALSMSAIATNGKIPSGGPYFLVSRNLGPAFGGAIGLLFYLGMSLATSLYLLGAISGFQEAFAMQGKFAWSLEAESLALLGLLAFVVYSGPAKVNQAAGVFLVVMSLSVVAIVLGLLAFKSGSFPGMDLSQASSASRTALLKSCLNDTQALTDIAADRIPQGSLASNFGSDYSGPWSFGTLLALFFPSVTGIMAGANRSDILAAPGVAIPKGTLMAIGTTTCLYIVIVWLASSSLAHCVLRTDPSVFILTAAVAWPSSYLVDVGIVMSCVGAGLQTLMGAPRLLNAIAKDNLIPVLGRFAAPDGEEPKAALALTTFIAALPCAYGSLNAVTVPVTLCFLAMYATMNLACFLLSVMKEPTWRPTFNAGPRGSRRAMHLLGVLICVALMFVTSAVLGGALLVVVWLLVKYIDSSPEAQAKSWGDVAHGMRFQQARDALLRLCELDAGHAKAWKPQLLVMCKPRPLANLGEPLPEGVPVVDDDAISLLRLANQLKKGRGLVLVRAILEGNISAVDVADEAQSGTALAARAAAAKTLLREQIERGGFSRAVRRTRLGTSRSADIASFASVLAARRVDEAVLSLAQDAGIGSLGANTVVLGWPARWRESGGGSGVEGSGGGGAGKAAAAPAAAPGLDAERFVGMLRGIVAAQRSLLILRGTFPMGREENRAAASAHAAAYANAANGGGGGGGDGDDDDANDGEEEEEMAGWRPSAGEDAVSVRAGGTIDVWWVVQDGGLLLLLSYLLRRHSTWRTCRVRVFCVVPASTATKPRSESFARAAGGGGGGTPKARAPFSKAPSFPSMPENNLSAPLMEVEMALSDSEAEEDTPEATVLRRLEEYVEELRFECEVKVVPLQKMRDEATTLFVSSPATEVYENLVLGNDRAPGGGSPRKGSVGGGGGVSAELRLDPSKPRDSSMSERREGVAALHERMREHSSDAELVLVNLPLSSSATTMKRETPHEVMESADLLSSGFKRVILVRGGGNSVVTVDG
jgi:amino acid transporter